MNEETENAKPVKKASLAAFIEHPERTIVAPKAYPRAAVETPPPGGKLRDSRPVVYLSVIGLFMALGLGLIVLFVWQHMQDKNKPHVPPKNMKMLVVEPK